MGEDKKSKCNNCGNMHFSKNLFCSKTCRDEFRFNDTLGKIKKGILKDTNRETIKKVILKLRGNKCEVCSTEEWNGLKIPLILDHIDGLHENNTLENLRLVCPNCDAQLPTYKSKNRGKGRKNRTIEYYKEQLKNQHGGYSADG